MKSNGHAVSLIFKECVRISFEDLRIPLTFVLMEFPANDFYSFARTKKTLTYANYNETELKQIVSVTKM